MISDRDVFSAGLFVVSFLLLVPLYRNYRKIKIEKFRHNLFFLRNRLLCSVYDMGISLDDKNYVGLRRVMNTFIAHADKLNAWILLSMFFETKKEFPAGREDANSLNDVRNEEYRKLLKEINSQLVYIFFLYALWSFIIALGVFFLCGLISSAYNYAIKKIKRPADIRSSNSVIPPVFQRVLSSSFLSGISSHVDNHIR